MTREADPAPDVTARAKTPLLCRLFGHRWMTVVVSPVLRDGLIAGWRHSSCCLRRGCEARRVEERRA